MIILPVLSVWCSGLPLEYIVASLPSSKKRNQPLEPVLSSSAHASLHAYSASRPRHSDHSRHVYATPEATHIASAPTPPAGTLDAKLSATPLAAAASVDIDIQYMRTHHASILVLYE